MSNDSKAQIEDRIKYLKNKIDEAPKWGAAVGAMSEELKHLYSKQETIKFHTD